MQPKTQQNRNQPLFGAIGLHSPHVVTQPTHFTTELAKINIQWSGCCLVRERDCVSALVPHGLTVADSNHGDVCPHVLFHVGGGTASAQNVAYVVETGDYLQLPPLKTQRRCSMVYSQAKTIGG